VSLFGPYPAIVDAWHDGDTCRLNIDLGFAIHLEDQPSCRIYGMNAPELNTDAGKAALAHVLTLCPVGTKVFVVSHGWDKYGGRFDGSLTLPDGHDLAASMIADGFAVEYLP
jgi:endonuclease YncB( thermonuclease family)